MKPIPAISLEEQVRQMIYFARRETPSSFEVHYFIARVVYNLMHNERPLPSDYKTQWIAAYLEERYGYNVRNGRR